MPYDNNRNAGPRPAPQDPALRELLGYLRDTLRDAASHIDRYLGDAPRGQREQSYDRGPAPQQQAPQYDRGFQPQQTERGYPHERGPSHNDRDRGPASRGPIVVPVVDVGTRIPLESLRDEARAISTDATEMDPAELRLRIEAVTAETRSLQNRASDPEDKDIAAKILRVLTAIVSEHRPGHVYGLARHHQADWDEVARRARQELAGDQYTHASESE